MILKSPYNLVQCGAMQSLHSGLKNERAYYIFKGTKIIALNVKVVNGYILAIFLNKTTLWNKEQGSY